MFNRKPRYKHRFSFRTENKTVFVVNFCRHGIFETGIYKTYHTTAHLRAQDSGSSYRKQIAVPLFLTENVFGFRKNFMNDQAVLLIVHFGSSILQFFLAIGRRICKHGRLSGRGLFRKRFCIYYTMSLKLSISTYSKNAMQILVILMVFLRLHAAR